VAGDHQRSATLILEAYGREVLGFLIAHVRDDEAVAEIFSQLAEDLWRGLKDFRWRCSARTWTYTLAHHAAQRHARHAQVRRKRLVPLSAAGPISELADRLRTATLPIARSLARDRLTRLRETLSPEDQLVLVLRVDRNLAWKEIAQVVLGDGESAEPEAIEKEAVRLRKRFQLIKEELRRLAHEEGLNSAGSDSQRGR
jgi:RNA polymerase sigma-70 factor (ECF subfamily)